MVCRIQIAKTETTGTETTCNWNTLAKCESVQKTHTNLLDILVNLTIASKIFQMLQGPLELYKVLSDSASALSGAPEKTCS